MVSDNLRIDELILQVFEEHEDMFFWPVNSQKDAKSFVKFLHEKGAPYDEIGKEIGEFEHNFSAWRKGLGRVGIGTRMLERINRTVEEVILSDGEDDTDHNLKLLSKINQKKQTKSTERESPKHMNGEKKPTADPKQQKADITQSMMKNIDRVSEQREVTTRDSGKPTDTGHKSDHNHTEVKPVPKTRTSPEKDSREKDSQSSSEVSRESSPQSDTLEQRNKSPSPAVIKEEPVQNNSGVKVTEKEENTRTEPPKVQDTTKSKEVPRIEVETQEDGGKRADPEMDEVKRKMEALKKKVEMMKKAKEQASAAATQQTTSSENPSNASAQETSEKYKAMKQKISDLCSRARDDETEESGGKSAISPDRKSDASEQDEEPDTLTVPPTNPPLVSAEEDADEDASSESTSSSDLSDDEDNHIKAPTYDSDLDPENYDSDLEFDLNKEAQRLSSEIQAFRGRLLRRDGPGHVFIFSDSPSSERGNHRLMVGASRNPEKKYEEARRYNLALKRVSAVAVDKRQGALWAAQNALRAYRIDGEKDWFNGPLDTILQRVSAATEKFGGGPALVSFSS